MNDSPSWSWGKYGSVIWIRRLSLQERWHTDELPFTAQQQKGVVKTGSSSRTSLIMSPAASRFDLRPQTVVSSVGKRNRSQTPAAWKAERLERLSRRRCFWNGASQDVAEQVGVWAVICVSRSCCCAVNHSLIIRQPGGKATTSIASIRLFRCFRVTILGYRSECKFA